MDCSDTGNCTIVAGGPVDDIGALRSGTPFIEVIEGIYLGFIFIHSSKHYYRPFWVFYELILESQGLSDKFIEEFSNFPILPLAMHE